MAIKNPVQRTLTLASLLLLSSTLTPKAFAQSQEWSNGQQADVVLGQTNFVTATIGLTATGMEGPASIAVDPTTGKVFVADTENSRVLRFSSYESVFNGGTAEAVLGQDNLTSASPGRSITRTNQPEAVFVDVGGRLWVCDSQNGRVLRFDNASTIPSGSAANGVLGQENFDDRDTVASRDSFLYPEDVVVSPDGTLFVADSFHNRVLRFDAAAAKANGANADGVLGQDNFTDTTSESDADSFRSPTSLALSGAGTLWVGDLNNNRVLRFDNASAKATGADADAVLGQTDLVSMSFYGAQTDSLPDTSGLAYSSVEDTLFVADQRNNRILVFEGASAKNGKIAANAVLGNSGTNDTAGLAQNRVNDPQNLAVDSLGRLWVADRDNNRVIRFSPDSIELLSDVRSDLTLGKSPGAQRGDGIVNTNGAGQQLNLTSKKRKIARVFFTQQNDGEAGTVFSIRGKKGNGLFKVSYRSLSAPFGNVTGAVTRGQFETPELDKDETHRLRMDVKPGRKTVGKKKTFRATLRSSDPRNSVSDLVRSQIKTKK